MVQYAFTITTYCFLFMCLLFGYGCNTANTTNNEKKYNFIDFNDTIYVRDDNIIDKSNDFIDHIRFVKLETSSLSILGRIDKIEILDDTLIILDQRSNILLTFDKNGKFVAKIGQVGKCANCYLSIRDFTVNNENGSIYILDTEQNKILTFSLTGSLKRVNAAPRIYPNSIAYLNGSWIYYNNKNTYVNSQHIKYDIIFIRNMRIINKFLPFEADYESWFGHKRDFYYYNNTLNFINYWKGEIIDFSEGKPKGRFFINFGHNALPLKYTKNASVFDQNRKDYKYLHSNFVENNHYLSFNYYSDGDIISGLFDKKRDHFYNISQMGFDLFLFQPIYGYDNVFISSIEPQHFIDAGSVVSDSTIVNLSKTLNSTDNPVLVYHYTKK